MTYELARQLKNAGFPQKEAEFNCQYCPAAFGKPKQPDAYAPTLEELIEACAETRFGLYLVADGWHAQKTDTEITAKGYTPTEAVARLWLALNAPKV